MTEPRACQTCGAVTEWTCPQDGAGLCRGGWERIEVDVYTNEARFTFACPHDGHPVDVIRATTGSVAYKVKSYVPGSRAYPALAPAEASVTKGGIVIRTRRKKR